MYSTIMPQLPEIANVEIRHIKDCPGCAIATSGDLWTCVAPGPSGRYRDEWHIKKVFIGKNGYPTVRIRSKPRYIHHLVLEAFVGPRPPGMECRHFPDRDRANCRLENLSWSTPSVNQMDRGTHGTSNRGERCGTSKLKESHVVAIRERAGNGECMTRIAKEFGVNQSQISRIVSRARWAHL